MTRAWNRIVPHLLAVILVAGAVDARAADWSVAQMSGRVSISVGAAQPVALTRGAVLPAGGILTTGPASRALLARNEETMVVGANTAIAVPPGSTNRQYTTILEKTGVVEFTVEKQNVQHFAVETPYLAAVVKGTQFTVEVTPSAGTVRVTRGVVEVTALATGYVTSITAGQSVTVRADGTLELAGAGPRPTVYQGTPRAPIVDLQFALNGGGGGGFGLFAGLGGVATSLGLGPASVEASLGSDGASASVSLGGAAIEASVGDGGVSVSASTGLADTSISVAPGGVDLDVSTGSAGVAIDVGGGGSVSVDLGPIHLGLGP